MPRSSIAIASVTLLLLFLSTLHLVARFGPNGLKSWIWEQTDTWSDRLIPSQWEQTDSHGTEYLLGVGKADITGPIVDINFMGYADTSQVGRGVRQRVYSRAFIVGDLEKPEDRFVYLVLDTQSGDTAVRYGILSALESLGGEYTMYGQQNVAITGTHSHSGPGAWLNYLLPQITSKGFDKASYQAIVNGSVESIKRAHESLAPGFLSVGEIEIRDANINRSPYAYLANPKSERQRYQHDVDKNLTLLRFTHKRGSGLEDIGVLTWFPVHGTSMYGNNTLVTGDNKGVAAYLFERSTRNSSFVAGFSQANVGDTSPNTLGAYCEFGDYAGEECDLKTSLCGNRSQPCHGRGPFPNLNDGGAASNFEIGKRQFEGARKLYDDKPAFTPIIGNVVRSMHQFVDFSNFHFHLPNGTLVKTCPAALGYSFAAGTTDGPGAFDFKQGQPGEPHANPFWGFVGRRVHTANDTQKACHGDKPILLDVGESFDPYAWTPNIVDIQVLRVGIFFIIVAPGEATTMAGRRWKEAVQSSASEIFGLKDTPKVVLGGPANTYAHYITTPEEYSIQRYEGASTLHGPHTLDAYINRTLAFLPQLDSSAPSRPHQQHGPEPPFNINASLSFITPVIVDRPGFFRSFGQVLSDVKRTYTAGETINATFVAANPRNNFRLGDTFAAVERYDHVSGAWSQVRNDEDWSLVFEWKRTSSVIGSSEATISWETHWETDQWHSKAHLASHSDLLIRDREIAGKYRLRYYGDHKSFGGKIEAFEGVSGEFVIR